MLPPRASCYMYSSRMRRYVPVWYSSRMRRYVSPPVWYSSRMLLLPYAHACMPACSSSSDAHLALLLLLGGRLGRPDRRAARKDALMQLVQNAATAAAALGGRRRQRGVPSAPLGGRRRQRRVPSAVPSAPRRTHRLEDRRLDLLRRRPVCTGSPMGPLKGSLMGRGERHERAATP